MNWWFALLGAVLTLTLVLAVGYAHVRYWRRRLTVPMAYAERCRLVTSDGAVIMLRRLPGAAVGRQQATAGLPPVLLVHGVGTNHRSLDLCPDCSLARHLAAQGREVWLLTLRCGLAQQAPDAAEATFTRLVHHDLPLAIEEVLRRSHHPCLDYVGLSLGGMLLYAALGHVVPERRVRRAAFVGAGLLVPDNWGLSAPKWLTRSLIPRLAARRLRLLAELLAFAADWLKPLSLGLLASPDSIPALRPATALVNAIQDVPGALLQDFDHWSGAPDRAITLDGQPLDVRLAGRSRPALFLAGGADYMAPASAVRRAYLSWGADLEDIQKRLIVLDGRTSGGYPYGHGDLTLGREVRADVFEPIGAFLHEAPFSC